MNAKFLAKKILYTAKLASNNKNYEPRTYKGICETTFKLRFPNQKIL